MKTLLLFLAIAYLGFAFYCARNSDKVLLPYQTFNIMGKFKCLMFTMFFCSGILGIAGFLILIFNGTNLDYIKLFQMPLIPSVISISIGIFIYRSIKNKCPEGPLKNKLMFNMLIAGFGMTFRAIFFFIDIAAEAVQPEKYVDEKGRIVYVFPDGSVYDENKNYVVGRKVSSDTYVRIKD